MALQTKTFTAGGTADTRYYSIQLKLTEESVSTAGNTSSVAYEFSIHRKNSGVYTGPYYSWTITIGGKSIPINNFAFNIPTSGAASQVIASGRLTIPHDADGGKVMSFQVYTPSAQDAAPSYGPPEIRLTGTWALTAIPRASSVSAINGDIGSATIITISRASAAFTHTVTYKFGSLTGTIAAKTGETTLSWQVPESFYGEIPNTKSGTVTLTCQTYSGNTLIGSKTATFRATASEEACKPSISGTAVVTDELTKSLTGADNRAIRYVSTVQASITASPRNGAAIAGRTVNGKALTDTLDFPQAETGTFVFAATDSRGYTGRDTKTLDMVSYIPLTLTALVSRKTPTGDIVVLDIKGNFWEGNFGAADNALTLSCQYRTGSGDWCDPVSVTGAAISQNAYHVLAEVSGMDYREGYVFRLTAGDCAMEVTREVSISAGVPVFDWGKEDFALHVLLKAVEAIFSGTLTLSKTTDASGTEDNGPALIVGGTRTTAHMEMDANEILAKSDGVTPAILNLNTNGGLVAVGSGGLQPANLTASRAVVTDGSKKLISSAVTATELGYLDGVTSNIQTQLNSKLSGSAAFAKLIYGGTISQNGTKTLDCGFTPQFCTYFMSSAGSAAPWVGGAVNFGKNNQEFRIYTSGSAYQRFKVSRSGNSVTVTKTGSDTVTLYLYAHR